MTAIGKIFVIINLLFSLVVAGFIVMVYARTTNWKDASDKWQKAAAVADASRQATETEMQQARQDAAQAKQAKDQKIAELNATIEARQADLKAAQTELEQVKKGGNKDNASNLAMQTELEKRKTEVTGLEKQVTDKDNQIIGLIYAKNQANDAKVAAEIKANSYQGKAERLEARLRETETEIVKLRRVGGAGGTGGIALTSSANPPSQNVEGLITEARGDLLRISIGSDAGLVKGHTLDVFRLKPTPQYLGQMRLTDVRANEAVGQMVEKPKYPVQKGDFVANDVTPRK